VPAGSWTSGGDGCHQRGPKLDYGGEPTAVRIVTDSLSSWERLQSMQMEMTLHSGVEADIADYLREIGRRGVEVGVPQPLWGLGKREGG
jgi:hypothetical protein